MATQIISDEKANFGYGSNWSIIEKKDNPELKNMDKNMDN